MDVRNKRRVGLILPSVNIHMEPEFNSVAELSDVNFYATRVYLNNTTEETLVEMEEGLAGAAELIGTVWPEAVIYACTSGSFIKGSEWDEQIMKKIEEICHCPAVTASRAMLNAIRHMGVHHLTLVTPYTDDINEREKDFLVKNGVGVASVRGMQIIPAEPLRTWAPDSIKALVREAMTPETDGVFISCTNVEGFDIATELEAELGVPVITSNTACLWALLGMLKLDRPISGHGKLLEQA